MATAGDGSAAAARARLLLGRTRALLVLFVVGLVLSGLTAYPLRWELEQLARLSGATTAPPEALGGLQRWLLEVRDGLAASYQRYPWLAYGTDWLAFAHLILGLLFLGALRDPVRNRWVVEFGLLACLLVIPYALIFGALRGIPFFWRLIDCSFGVFGLLPLVFVWRWIRELERLGAAAGAPAPATPAAPPPSGGAGHPASR
jgi:hypothetical protein